MRYLKTLENNKGQATGSEVALILILIAVIAGILWYELSKKTKSDVFESGSQSVTIAPHPTLGGCSILKVYTIPEDKNVNTKNSH